MKYFLITIFFLAISQFLWAQDTPEWKDINYAGDTLTGHLLDIYLPPTGDGPFPVVVSIAGSAWFGNNTKKRAYKSVKTLLDAGFALVAVNHRSSRQAIFPAQLHDIKAAVRFIRGNAGQYQLDSRFIGIAGNSSGGHLSAMMGTTRGLNSYVIGASTLDLEGDLGNFTDQSSHVDAVVDWYGPTDFIVMDSCGSRLNHDTITSPESTLIGGLIQENKDLCALANPITYVDPDDPPIFILHGDADRAVPHCQSILLHDAIQNSGGESNLIIVPEGGHGKGMYLPKYMDEVINFFNRERNHKITK